MDIFYQPVTVKSLIKEPSLHWIMYYAKGGGLFNFLSQATRSLVIHFNEKFGHFQLLLMVACIPQVHVYLGSLADQSDWSLVIHFGRLPY